ncbi:amidohydrolase family protein [Brevibacterium album]|uniref:amidohydrolase family protein n=1 Tax=Brevibacterium album TaxID=417948 RepID=UPI0003FC7F2A|nr:amidohydrolase family protein [Brevibacterium album]
MSAQTPSVSIPADEPARLRAITAELGIPGFVDVHTHFMPVNVLDKVWRYFDAAAENGKRPWPIAYRFDEGERVHRLRELGVLRFTSMLYPHRPGMADWLNDWAADFAARTPDCAHTATFYPEPEAGAGTQRALASGAAVFKAHVQVGGYDPADRLLDPVWAQIQEAGAPVVIHCGSGPVAGSHTGMEPVAEVLARFPRLRLVIAHSGLPEYAEFLQLAEDCERVCLDTCMTFTDFTEATAPFPEELLPRFAQLALDGRVVLGSDYPNIPYPYVHQIEAIRGLGLGAEVEAAILHDNGAVLLGGGC